MSYACRTAARLRVKAAKLAPSPHISPIVQIAGSATYADWTISLRGRSKPARPNPETLLPNLPGSECLKFLVKPLLRQVHRVGDPGHRLEADEILGHASAPAGGTRRE